MVLLCTQPGGNLTRCGHIKAVVDLHFVPSQACHARSCSVNWPVNDNKVGSMMRRDAWHAFADRFGLPMTSLRCFLNIASGLKASMCSCSGTCWCCGIEIPGGLVPGKFAIIRSYALVEAVMVEVLKKGGWLNVSLSEERDRVRRCPLPCCWRRRSC